MLTLAKALNLEAKTLQDLISNKTEFLIEACQHGVDGSY